MLIFELLSLELPYSEIKKTWLISDAIVKGVLPKLPDNLGEEYSKIVDLFKSCVSKEPSLRPNAVELVTTITELKNSM